MSRIITDKAQFSSGCDFILQLESERENTEIKLLQITDMQFIDSMQRRTPDRIRIDEINAWKPENFDALCGNQIRSLVAQTKPDLIFITGDMVYGSFDDSGRTFERFCDLMDSFGIPWAPLFGNHDNESKMGVEWQCERLKRSKNCLFERGEVSGNCNYTIGIAVGDRLIRVLHMLDSNGCWDSNEEAVIRYAGIYPDQLALIEQKSEQIAKTTGRPVPSFLAFHIPTEEFALAEESRGYKTDSREFYTIGVDVKAHGNDFGFKYEYYTPIKVPNFMETLKKCNAEAVFVGHCHSINTCIDYEGIKWVFGLKTGQYDYHIPGQLGGTLVRLSGDSFDVCHVPALTPYAPYPGGAKMFDNFFAEDKTILPD